MARIHEALRSADAIRLTSSEAAALPRTLPTVSPVSPEAESIVEFIEVGGKDCPIDGSPAVLAHRTPVLVSPIPAKSQHARVQELPPPRSNKADVVALSLRSLAPDATPLKPPNERFSRDLVTLYQHDNPISLQFDTLAQSIGCQLSSKKSHILLLSAAQEAIDTSSVVLNLAITKARMTDCRIVIVDAALHCPRVADRLGLTAAPGLRDVVAGRVSLRHAIRDTGLKDFFAVTAGKVLDEGPNVLAGDAMRSVLRHLRSRFDWVLINAPCWDGRPDLVAMGAACDGVYLLMLEKEASSPKSAQLVDLVQQQGSQLKGCILLRTA